MPPSSLPIPSFSTSAATAPTNKSAGGWVMDDAGWGIHSRYCVTWWHDGSTWPLREGSSTLLACANPPPVRIDTTDSLVRMSGQRHHHYHHNDRGEREGNNEQGTKGRRSDLGRMKDAFGRCRLRGALCLSVSLPLSLSPCCWRSSWLAR